MRPDNFVVKIRLVLGATLLVVALAGCARAAPPAPANPPAPEATPPADPSAAPKPAAANEPSLESMHAATPSAKMGVAADLKYSFDGEVLPGQPVTLHIAAVPRVAGTTLNVTMRQVAGVQVAAGALRLEKAGDSNVYRQVFSVTRQATGPTQLRVLVTMDMPAGSTFGFFSVPLEAGTTAQKQDSVKQR